MNGHIHCVWVLSFSIMVSSFIHVVAYFIYFFVCWKVFHFMDIPHYVHQFINWWTFGLCSPFATMNKAAMILVYEILCGHVFSNLWYRYLGLKLLAHMAILCLTFWGTVKLYSKVLCYFIFPPATYKSFNFSATLPTFAIVRLCLP